MLPPPRAPPCTHLAHPQRDIASRPRAWSVPRALLSKRRYDSYIVCIVCISYVPQSSRHRRGHGRSQTSLLNSKMRASLLLVFCLLAFAQLVYGQDGFSAGSDSAGATADNSYSGTVQMPDGSSTQVSGSVDGDLITITANGG